jgi:hypothetical protein
MARTGGKYVVVGLVSSSLAAQELAAQELAAQDLPHKS